MALTRPRASATRSPASTAAGGDPGRATGLGAGGSITVKGKRASAAQRATIDACLSEGARLGAARRVLVAIVMTITQESEAGDPRLVSRGDAAGPDSRGPYQQRAPWGPLATRMDPAGATRLFLTANKGHGVQGWKVVHDGLSNAPGSLSAAINAVQLSAFPNAYAQWQDEAERTVATWLGGGDSSGAGDTRYEFTRGERGGARESSWDATGRLAEEVSWRRWAAGNVAYFVSDAELRQAAPSLTVHADEPWLLGEPQWEWATARAVTEITLRVLAERWSVMPGAVVIMAMGGPTDGRWLVKSVGGQRLDGLECEVVLIRPTMRMPEPAAEAADGADAASGAGQVLIAASKRISDAGGPYLLGGGHGPALSAVKPGDPMDCSSAVSKALFDAQMFPGSAAIASGAFVSSWGKPGKGRVFTVAASPEHVFIAFASGPYKRFDTSPHGSGERGPRLRTTERSLDGFTLRHWSGL